MYAIKQSFGRPVLSGVPTVDEAREVLNRLGRIIDFSEDADHPDHYDAAVLTGTSRVTIYTIEPVYGEPDAPAPQAYGRGGELY